MARLTASLLAVALASGCAAARMQVDPALASSAEVWRVSGANPRRWNAPLSVGPYRTGPVRDGGTLGWSVQILNLGVSSTHRPYAWALAGPGGALDAECHERGFEAWTTGGLAVDVHGSAGKPVLACAFRGAGEGAAWTLALRATGKASPAYAGELRHEATGAVYGIRASHALEGSPLPLGTPAGYAVERGGAPVLTVETLGAGRVWARPAPGDAAALAATSVALLLFRPDGT